MIYKDSKDLEPGRKIWACAYEFDNNKITMNLSQKPIYGEIYHDGWSKHFVPYKKNGELAMSKMVRSRSRVYADTYQECVELYNSLVRERVDWFMQRAEETADDYIEIDE